MKKRNIVFIGKFNKAINKIKDQFKELIDIEFYDVGNQPEAEQLFPMIKHALWIINDVLITSKFLEKNHKEIKLNNNKILLITDDEINDSFFLKLKKNGLTDIVSESSSEKKIYHKIGIILKTVPLIDVTDPNEQNENEEDEENNKEDKGNENNEKNEENSKKLNVTREKEDHKRINTSEKLHVERLVGDGNSKKYSTQEKMRTERLSKSEDKHNYEIEEHTKSEHIDNGPLKSKNKETTNLKIIDDNQDNNTSNLKFNFGVEPLKKEKTSDQPLDFLDEEAKVAEPITPLNFEEEEKGRNKNLNIVDEENSHKKNNDPLNFLEEEVKTNSPTTSLDFEEEKKEKDRRLEILDEENSHKKNNNPFNLLEEEIKTNAPTTSLDFEEEKKEKDRRLEIISEENGHKKNNDPLNFLEEEEKKKSESNREDDTNSSKKNKTHLKLIDEDDELKNKKEIEEKIKKEKKSVNLNIEDYQEEEVSSLEEITAIEAQKEKIDPLAIEIDSSTTSNFIEDKNVELFANINGEEEGEEEVTQHETNEIKRKQFIEYAQGIHFFIGLMNIFDKVPTLKFIESIAKTIFKEFSATTNFLTYSDQTKKFNDVFIGDIFFKDQEKSIESKSIFLSKWEDQKNYHHDKWKNIKVPIWDDPDFTKEKNSFHFPFYDGNDFLGLVFVKTSKIINRQQSKVLEVILDLSRMHIKTLKYPNIEIKSSVGPVEKFSLFKMIKNIFNFN